MNNYYDELIIECTTQQMLEHMGLWKGTESIWCHDCEMWVPVDDWQYGLFGGCLDCGVDVHNGIKHWGPGAKDCCWVYDEIFPYDLRAFPSEPGNKLKVTTIIKDGSCMDSDKEEVMLNNLASEDLPAELIDQEEVCRSVVRGKEDSFMQRSLNWLANGARNMAQKLEAVAQRMNAESAARRGK